MSSYGYGWVHKEISQVYKRDTVYQWTSHPQMLLVGLKCLKAFVVVKLFPCIITSYIFETNPPRLFRKSLCGTVKFLTYFLLPELFVPNPTRDCVLPLQKSSAQRLKTSKSID